MNTTTFRRPTRGRSAGLGAMLLVATLVACGDDPLGPSDGATPGAHLLELSGVPTLASLMQAYGTESIGLEALEDGAGRFDGLGSDGVGLRGGEDGGARFESLARAMGPDGLRDAVDRLADATNTLSTALPGESARGRLEEARADLDTARSRLLDGNELASLLSILRAADALTRIPPEVAVADLASCAERGIRRIQARPSYEEVWVARARRLRVAALQAMEAGDEMRALQRAYYACKIVERH